MTIRTAKDINGTITLSATYDAEKLRRRCSPISAFNPAWRTDPDHSAKVASVLRGTGEQVQTFEGTLSEAIAEGHLTADQALRVLGDVIEVRVDETTDPVPHY
ncbi:hypothetical protein [Mycolicibacterium sp. CBMA 361]|nr:hypothetical protein [Mycolicibacterium sp. CBMA 361]MUM32057.1 hypothetical protein [Mycolicibacterium sp. CBMA 361]